ncbi:MAG TPA: hypothetical protein VH681_07310 [Nitrospiraceae bacterium]|jgi:hypothetical protein
MWNTMEEEVEHRRLLLRLAAKGNAQARAELEQEYHACVYSAAQVAKYVPQSEPRAISAAVQRTLDTLADVHLDAA